MLLLKTSRPDDKNTIKTIFLLPSFLFDLFRSFSFSSYFYSCSEMLELGKSKPWPEALEKLTNKRTMDVGPLKEYFWPLYLWLRSQRCSLNYKIGWPENPGPSYDPCVVPTTLPDTDTQTSPVNNQPNNGAVHAWYLILIAVFSFLLGC